MLIIAVKKKETKNLYTYYSKNNCFVSNIMVKILYTYI